MFGKKKKTEELLPEAQPEPAPAPIEEKPAEIPAEKPARGLFKRKKKEAPAPEPAPAPQPEPVKESRRAKKKREKEEAKAREEEKRRIEAEVRKEAEKKYARPRFSDFFAFTILILASALLLLGPVLKLILQQTGGAEAMTTVSTVAQYCLLAAIAISAWSFVYKKKFIWKVVFFVALAVFIGGSILGLTL